MGCSAEIPSESWRLKHRHSPRFSFQALLRAQALAVKNFVDLRIQPNGEPGFQLGQLRRRQHTLSIFEQLQSGCVHGPVVLSRERDPLLLLLTAKSQIHCRSMSAQLSGLHGRTENVLILLRRSRSVGLLLMFSMNVLL